MIDLTRPSSFVPLHGTLHHLTRHEELAKKSGIARTCLLENGHVGELFAGNVIRNETVVSGRVHIGPEGAISRATIAERVALGEGGAAFVCVPVDARGILVGSALISTRGLGDETRMTRLFSEVENEIRGALALAPSTNDEVTREAARMAARRAFARTLGHKPVTVVSVVRTGEHR